MDNNVLKIYTNDEQPFAVSGEEVVVSSYRYQTTRMSVSPTITATIKHRYCLDDEWTGNEYVTFRGERYYIKQIPTSSKANDDSRYVHELVFVSEREILKDVLFYDVVGNDESDNKYVSNSTKVYFFGTIHEYASRLNASLAYRNLDYSVVVDSSVANDESKEVSFEDKFISEVIQEVYNIYEIPFYFVDKVIHFGEPQDKLSGTIFEYGAKNSLLSIKKTNANKKIVTHITGHGSSENLPSYYPNPSPTGIHTYEANGLQVKDINYALLNKSIKIFEGAYLTYKLDSGWGGLSQSYKTSYSAYFYDNAIPAPTIVDGYLASFTKDIVTTLDAISLKIAYQLDFNIPAKGKVSIRRYATFENSGDAKPYTKTLWDVTIKDENGYALDYEINSITDEIVVTGGDEPKKATLSGRFSSNEHKNGTILSVVLDAHPIYDTYDEPSFEATNPANDKKTIPLSKSGITLETIPTIEGGTITISEGTLIPSMPYLMPSIYRKSLGTQRFYKAKNYPFEYVDGYVIDSDAGEYVEDGLVYNEKYLIVGKDEFFAFDNIYNETSPKEGIVNFEDTKPTIEATGYNTILDVAYDEDDNNELNDKNEYIHPYFYVKLQPTMDFNLFDHALEGQAMSISMKTGDCSACTFDIQVNDAMRNPVQVKEDGTLERDDNGRVVIDVAHPQDKQNTTLNNSVWIALMKDNKSYATTMPNDTQKVKSGDSFVILNIALPQSYIDHAESTLDAQLINVMYENNSDKFSFTIKLSRIYLADNPNVLQALDENSLIKVRYNDRVYGLYVSNYTYNQNADEALPEVSVDLTDTLSVSKSAIAKIGDNIRKDVNYLIESSGLNVRTQGYLVRRAGKLVTDRNLAAENKVSISRANMRYSTPTNTIEVSDEQDEKKPVNLSVTGGVSAKGIADFGLNGGGGGKSNVQVKPLTNDGKPIAQITVDEETNTIYAPDVDISGKVDKSAVGKSIAPLDDNGIIPNAYLPSYVDDTIEVDTFDNLPQVGEGGKIYVVLDTDLTYRWSGSGYREISKSIALGETDQTAYMGSKGKKNAEDIAKLSQDLTNEVNARMEKDTLQDKATQQVKEDLVNEANARANKDQAHDTAIQALQNLFTEDGKAKNADKLDGKSIEELFDSLDANGAINITIGGVKKTLTKSELLTMLGFENTGKHNLPVYYEDEQLKEIDSLSVTGNIESTHGGVSAKGIADFGTPSGTGGTGGISVLRDDEVANVTSEDVTQVASAYAVKKIRDIINIDLLPQFSIEESYVRGDVVVYNGEARQFTQDKAEGAWRSGITRPYDISAIATPLAIEKSWLKSVCEKQFGTILN